MDRAEIIRSLEYSTAAYRDIQPYTPHTLTVMVDNPRTGVQYFFRRDGETLWITFRGSDSHLDWKHNLTFWRKCIPYDNTDPEIRVHTGFLEDYKACGVRDVILKEITEDIRFVKITGHSLGAALSVLCAVDVQYNRPETDIEVILFGCPRVGNKAFVKSYNKRVDKTVRVENGNDVVTKVPPAIFGFRHVGAKMHIGMPRLPVFFRALDHYPHRYYSNLLKGFYM